MTKAAAHFGKQLVHFWSNRETDEYLLALARSMELIPRNSDEFDIGLVRDAYDALVESKMGRYGGTWGHPKLAVFFARWLDVKFAVWCDSLI